MSRARQWALVNGGKGGGEKEEREGGAQHATHKHTTRHNKTQTTQGKGKEYYKGGSGILRSFEAAVRISFRVGSGVCTYNESGVPCTTRYQETVGGRQM